MEKDKRFVLDVCGAYDIKKLSPLLESAERINEKQLKFLGLTILT